MPAIQPLIGVIGVACLAVAAAYAVLVLMAVLVWQIRRTTKAPLQRPPVTILKPLYGAEPSLYENLRSFCQQDYPNYQIVFGVRDRADPALRVAKRLVAEFPSLPIEVVVSSEQHGSNRKISNLVNMIAQAHHLGARAERQSVADDRPLKIALGLPLQEVEDAAA